jgi:N-ethylmaleimide reductase
MSESILFKPYTSRGFDLKNRVVMAPMTRCRAIGNIPNALMAEYYAQRVSAGLLITEGTSPAADGLGYARIPGLFSQEQAEGWKTVTDAVHAKGGKIVVQLMHCGRVGHPANLPEGARLLGPSAVAAPGQMYTDSDGMQDFPAPEAMTEDEIETAIESYVHASKLAIDVAGFDGVELHGANGYLIDQFLNTASNQRTDAWGGDVAGRVHFALEVARRTTAAIGARRVGMRVSPFGASGGMRPDPEHLALYDALATGLNGLGLAYIHVVDHSSMGAPTVGPEIKAMIRDRFKGTYILSGGYDRKRAEADLLEKKGDLVAFGRPFISNPDLVARLKNTVKLAAPNMDLAYTPGPAGYTDYPTA